MCVSSGQTGKVGPISKFAFLSDKDLCQDISLIPNQKALLGESFESRSDFSDFRAALKFCLFLREDRQPSLENMHEATFRKCAEGVGINPYMVEIANIREQCSWVISNDDMKSGGSGGGEQQM